MKTYKIKKEIVLGVVTHNDTVDFLIHTGSIQIEGDTLYLISPAGFRYETNAIPDVTNKWILDGCIEEQK